MNDTLHRALSVASLMSRVPVRLNGAPDYSSADWMIPLSGLASGLAACAGAGAGLLLFGPGPLAAAVAMAAQYLAFNLFHLDGLLDSADAAGVLGDKEKRKAVLKDPRIGSYAFFIGFLALASRLAATASILSSGSAAAWGTLVIAPAAGRLAAMLVCSAGTPAETGGLGASLGKPSALKSAFGYAAAAAPGALLWALALGPFAGAAAMLAGAFVAIAVGLGVSRWYGKRIGGYTGDALGAAIELGELSVLLSAAATLG